MAFTLKRLNTSARIGLSFFLLTIIIGTVSALIMLGLLLTHQKSGFAIPTVENIKLKYHYPQLVSAMKTSMYQHVADDADIETVKTWIAEGSQEKAYTKDIRPILKLSCTSCHNPSSTMTGAAPGIPLTSYKETLRYTEAGYGWVKMAKQAHVHLFGIGTFLVLVTGIFAFTSFRPWIRNTLISVCWVALLLDVLSWWLTKYMPGFAYVIVGAGAAMSGTAIAMSALALLDFWIVVPFITAPAPDDPASPKPSRDG